MPLAVARPVDAEDVAELVRWAATEGIFLVPRGGGTGMPGGNVGSGVVVDFSMWTATGPIDTEARTVHVQPGVVGERLDITARARGLFFPALPSSADRCTLGGMIANNAAGARSFGYGSVHAWVGAVEVVLADGAVTTLRRGGPSPESFSRLRETLRASLGPTPRDWPAVRKNSSGYALDRFLSSGDPATLIVGSEGTLGIVTGAELLLAPEPERHALVLFPVSVLDDLGAVLTAADTVGASACEFFASSFLDVSGLRSHPPVATLARDVQALALVEVVGSLDEVERALDALRSLAGSLGSRITVARSVEDRERLWSIRHAASPIVASRAAEGLVSIQFIEDSVVPPNRLVDYLRALERILASEETEAVMFGHAGDGHVHVNPLVDLGRRGWRDRVRRILEAAADLVAGLGGTLSGEHGDGRIRAPYLERVWGPKLSEAFHHVKRSLDPAGIFNPGVIVPLPGQDPLAGLTPHREPRR